MLYWLFNALKTAECGREKSLTRIIHNPQDGAVPTVNNQNQNTLLLPEGIM